MSSPNPKLVLVSSAGGDAMSPIVLAHEQPFRIGALEVRPATRTLKRDGIESVVEPRVMQVLVALFRAEGGVVTRDELVESCWEGRIVGDDAINRVLSRLRHLEHDLATGVFRVETITRVGYRLVQIGEAPADDIPAVPPSRPGISRRALLATGGGTTAALAVAGGTWWALRGHDPLSSAARDAMDRGYAAIRETTPDQTSVAVAAFRDAADLAPDAVEPWGQLALAYQQQIAGSGAKDAADAARIEQRARAAIARTLAIDRRDADARTALATLPPNYRHWYDVERGLRSVLADFPAHGAANRLYGIMLAEVGRNREGLECIRRAIAADPRWPQVHVRLFMGLSFNGQLDQADAEMERTFAIWPRHFSVWFARQRILTYTGRTDAALAMLADKSNRPIGIPDWNWTMTEAETRAIGTRAKTDIDAASRLLIEGAHKAAGFAINAIIFHAVVGRIDEAFALIDAYYFDRGFSVGSNRYSEEQGMYDTHRQRLTNFLMAIDMAPLRADPRFKALTRAIGLDDYWRRSGTRPDVG
ncbi:hypothetical protein BH09PSE4_BH09PSE4_07440 [soil metagenome]